MIIYDLFEEVTETALSSLQTLLAALTRRGEYLHFRVQFQCGELPVEFSCSQQLKTAVEKAGGQILYERQEDTACVSLRLPERSGE